MTYFEQMVRDYQRKGLPKLNIRDKRVPHQWNTFSGVKRKETKCITFHNSGIDGVSAWGSDNWIRNYSPENKDKVSWTATIDYDGSIWQHAEWDDLVWASGTTPENYTKLGKEEYKSKPYEYDLPVEISTINHNGQELYINETQLVACALFGVHRLFQFKLEEPSNGTFRRHGDFAINKPDCPRYLMDPANWKKFIDMGDDIYDLLYKEKNKGN